MKQIIFLDTETTWFTEWIITQLAFATPLFQWDNPPESLLSVMNTCNIYFTLKESQKIELWAKATTHITEDFLKKTGQNLEMFLKFYPDIFKNKILIAHNYLFDKEILEKNWFNTEWSEWIDTMTLAYNLQPEIESHSLQFLRYYFNIELEWINPNDALSDVLVLIKLFERLSEDCSTLKYMIEETKKGIIYQKLRFWKYKDEYFSSIVKKDRQYLNWLLWEKNKEEKKDIHFINTLEYWLNYKEPEILDEDLPF